MCGVHTGRLEKTEASFKLYIWEVQILFAAIVICHTVSYKIKKLKLLRANWPMQFEENLVSIRRSAVLPALLSRIGGLDIWDFSSVHNAPPSPFKLYEPPWLEIPTIKPWAPPYHTGSSGTRPQMVTRELKIRPRRRLRKRDLKSECWLL